MKNKAIWIFIAVILVLFIFSSYITNESEEFINKHIDKGIFGMLIYICAIMLEIIFAPINPLPLVPIATGIWKWKIAGVLTLIGWTLGSLIAFTIARRGVSLFEKRYAFQKIRKVEKIIPEKNVFLGLILIRITLPFDLI